MFFLLWRFVFKVTYYVFLIVTKKIGCWVLFYVDLLTLFYVGQIFFFYAQVIICSVMELNALCLWWSFAGVDGGFDNNEIEYEEKHSIVILPNYVTLPFPSVELPEKVLIFLSILEL